MQPGLHITLIPQRRDQRLALERHGDTLILNGDPLDLSAVPEGGTLPPGGPGSPWLAGEVTREGGALRLALVLPHGPDAPPGTLFPEPLSVTADGPVPLPPWGADEPAPES